MNTALRLTASQKAMLAETTLAAGLNGEQRRALVACAAMVAYQAEDVLFHEHEEARYFYCVLGGYVRLYRLGTDGREADIRICEPGESFGECLIIDGEHYYYHAQATEHTVLARFDLRAVRQLLDEQPRIARAMMRSLSQHLLSTMDCLASNRMETAPQRVAHYLLENCLPEGITASMRLPFQKSLLARKLGLAPEALSRAFSALRPAGVTVRGRAIAISDINALRQV